ncbi:SAM-dependent methyltransferase [Aquabacterium parvum]|uniref:SAM-dependent methyltransferase n=1 Tax=Aquabacterium parvum TaxID=70584 RepID=UPI000718E662|nr:SAM-dependent methyltransferase [Aquabacterium parvum]MBU0918170.1 SAM-dependent methyltransferase [Gammaproteobacteria bacterium]
MAEPSNDQIVPRTGERAGRLLLVPNTLDLGCPDPVTGNAPDLQQVLPLGVIREAARIAHWIAENAKTTRAFLKRVDQVTPLSQALQSLSIVELARPVKGGKGDKGGKETNDQAVALASLLAPARAGHDVGLISEAGLPGVADPGAAVVQAAHQAGIQVVPLSGPSSLVLALAGSGLHGQSFAFVGYLPTDASLRAQRIRELELLSRKAHQTQLVIETPYRNATMWQALLQHLQPQTLLNVSCGLTLSQGFTLTDTVARWRKRELELPNDVPAVFAWLSA